MAGFKAIEAAGSTLVDLLRSEMGRDERESPSAEKPILDEQIVLISPGEIAKKTSGQDVTVRLSLYLYRVTRNDQMNNEGRRVTGVDTVERSPLALDLHYLLTAYPADGTLNETSKREQQHRVLGRAIQVFEEHAVVEGAALEEGLEEPLHLSMLDQSMDEVLRIWNTFEDRPYQPSVAYLATPVDIEPRESEEIDRVIQRRTPDLGGADDG